MIQRILVALDPDTDTPVATHYAAEIAGRCGAEILGIAVVDLSSIGRGSVGGGIGSMYLAEKMEAQLTEEARAVAGQLLSDFKAAVSGAGVASEAHVQEGVPVARITEEMNYCDLLIVGRDPHFYYSHPKETPLTLGRLVKDVVGPVLIAPEVHREVKRVLIAFDGGPGCVRSLRSFLYHRPFGEGVQVDVVNVHLPEQREHSQLLLQNARTYMKKHGLQPDIHSVAGSKPAQEILRCVERFESDLLVAGAQFVTPLTQLTRGSTTKSLMSGVEIPMWLED